jgi:NAD(P) transhydrogenase subunit alpha
LAKQGVEVLLEAGAGIEAGFPDSEYQAKGAKLAAGRAELFASADAILQVRGLGANPQAGQADMGLLRPDQTLIALLEPLSAIEQTQALAERKVIAFAMELMPRITRAQSMDALSSQATITGYKAALLAADTLPRMFPMMTTAAGTAAPARIFVIGAGVAGLQAIATAHRLGAVVQAFDVRPAVREQVQSVGAKFVELELTAAEAEEKTGYAKALGEDFYRRQRELMGKVVAASDVVITTAAVPGKRAPILVTADMVRSMAPGSVIVDLAAERGGNCEGIVPGETVKVNGVTLLAPLNLPSTVPYHASQMYSRNISTFLLHLVKEGRLQYDEKDEIVKETLLTRGGEVVHPRAKEGAS